VITETVRGTDHDDGMLPGLKVATLDSKIAAQLVVAQHYLHRRPSISFAYGLHAPGRGTVGVVTYGVPASRHLQKSACPTQPDLVVELNRLWVHDDMPKNTESWFVSRTLKMLPPLIVVSYADPLWGHIGYIYRALSFHYAGWTDMERKTPRFDYLPADPRTHTRDAFRNGYVAKRRRVAKVKYWTATGTKSDKRRLTALAGWPMRDWHLMPPPVPELAVEDVTGS
jgi:hypothetical protein